MQNKGNYSLITTFVVVVAIVFVMLFLLNSILTQEARSALYFNHIAPLSESIDIKDNIINCTGNLTTEFLDNAVGTNQCLMGNTKGYQIKNIGLFGCGTENWVIGSMEDCGQKFSFLANVKDSEANTCLARMFICTKKMEE